MLADAEVAASPSPIAVTPCLNAMCKQTTLEGAAGSGLPTVDILVETFLDAIWVVVRDPAATTHGIVSWSSAEYPAMVAATVAGGDSHSYAFDGPQASFGNPVPSTSSSSSPFTLDFEEQVLLGSREEALSNVLRHAIATQLTLEDARFGCLQPRGIMFCSSLLRIPQELPSPAHKKAFVDAVVDCTLSLFRSCLAA